MNGQNTGSATIPAGASVTPWIDLRNGSLLALIMPAAFTGTDLTFQASDDGVTPYEFAVEGNLYSEPAGINQWIVFTGNPFDGVNYLKIRSGTLLSPSVQQYDATFQLIGTVQTVEPNPRRTINIERIGLIKAFPAFGELEADAVTFNWSRKLAPGETITDITSFGLTVLGPMGATDPAPDLRALGTASVSGAQISQRFGNWQQGIGPIWYLVEAVAETSFGNTLAADGVLPVGVPVGWCWDDYCW